MTSNTVAFILFFSPLALLIVVLALLVVGGVVAAIGAGLLEAYRQVLRINREHRQAKQ